MRIRTWFILALTMVIWLVLVACGGTDSGTSVERTSASDASGSTRVQPATVGVVGDPPVEAQSVQIVPGTDAIDASSLDADEIVAAYEQVLGRIYESVLPSVVLIKVEKNPTQRPSFPFQQTPEGFTIPGEGSGFVWSELGHVVTNYHVIDGADQITVVFADGSEFEAEILGGDPDSDLAMLSIDAPGERLQAVSLGDSSRLNVGQLAIAIGSPFGQEFTMTRGIVSALGRVVSSSNGNFSNPLAIQTDAPINPGNSGGPLLDRLGNVIGINSQIISRSGVSAGVGFAVPINTAKRVIPELIANGSYQHAYLGISGMSLNSRLAEANGLPQGTDGVLIVQVVPDGPAGLAGLIGSDRDGELDFVQSPSGGQVITTIDGVDVDGMDDLIVYLAEYSRPGDMVTLEVLTNGVPSSIGVTLGARPTAATS